MKNKKATKSTLKFDPNFNQFFLNQNVELNIFDTSYPTQVTSWNQNTINLPEGNAHYGFVFSGTAILTTSFGVFELKTGMYFSISENFKISNGSGVIFSRINFQCNFSIGSSRDEKGQLEYIDGATASVLIHPEIKGYPILNSLYLPQQTYQTMHIHPDIRVGLVFKGSGYCYTPDALGRIGSEFEVCHNLQPGAFFYIPTDGKHRFVTTDNSLVIIPWHAHSDSGVDDDSHYMLDRSIAKIGVSGNESWLGENIVIGKQLRNLDKSSQISLGNACVISSDQAWN